MLPGLYQCYGLFYQVVDALIEVAEARILCLAAMETHIDLLQHHRQLEEREHFVIVDEREIAPGFFSVAAEKLIAREPAWLQSDRRLRPSWITGLRPVAENEPEIYKRIPDSRHLPVEHGLNLARIARVQHEVVQLEIIVNQRRSGRNGQTIGEPLDEPVHPKDLLGFRAFPALEPTAHLAV